MFFALILYLLRTDARAIEISFTSSNGSSHPFYSDCPPLFLCAGQPIKLLLAGRRSILFSIVNFEIYIFGRLLWRMKHFLLRLFLMSPSEANLYSSSTAKPLPSNRRFSPPDDEIEEKESLNAQQWNKWAAATSNKREKRNSLARAQFIKNSLAAASGQHKELHNSRPAVYYSAQ